MSVCLSVHFAICQKLYLLQCLSIVSMLWHISAQRHWAKNSSTLDLSCTHKRRAAPTACQTVILHFNKLPHSDSNLSLCISPLNLHLNVISRYDRLVVSSAKVLNCCWKSIWTLVQRRYQKTQRGKMVSLLWWTLPRLVWASMKTSLPRLRWLTAEDAVTKSEAAMSHTTAG